MFPSSAAMLKNLQQRAASNFLMENLLQSKTAPGTDFSLTLNLAASLVACQREKEAEYLMMISNGESGNGEQRQHHQQQQHQQQDLESSGRVSVESSAGGGGQLDRSGDSHNNHSHQLMTGCHPAERTCGDSRGDDCSVSLDERFNLKRSASGEIYLDTKRFKRNNMLVNRLDLVRPVERMDNRSNSAAESANSLDELDQTSGGDQEVGVPPDVDRPESIVSSNVDLRATSCWIANPMDGRFADFAAGRGTDHANSVNDETHQQQQQQHNGRSIKIQGMKTEDSRIVAEETCTCGEEQCPGLGDCNTRRIQEKDKPELKFGVRRILADDHNMRRNPDHILYGRSVGVIPGFSHNLQQNPGGYVIAKPIARPTAYHPHHLTPQHHFPTNTHTLQLIGRVPYITVADIGPGSNHAGVLRGNPGSFPGGMPPGMTELPSVGPVFPWSTSPRGRPRKGMMRRAVFSDTQRKGLENRFLQQKYISKPDRKRLAEKLGLKDSQVKIWFQNRRMKWRNNKERQLLANGGSREQTLPNKNNPHPDLSDVDGDGPRKDLEDTSPLMSPKRSPDNSDNDDDEEINVT